MAVSGDLLNVVPIDVLIGKFAIEYDMHIPSALMAIGACAGFASQIAVWRELVEPSKCNPGDFLVIVTTKTKETYFFGGAINAFLYATYPDRLSFISLAASGLKPADMPDIKEMSYHVGKTIGTEEFGIPRIPEAYQLRDKPRSALQKMWPEIKFILEHDKYPCREWPALLGATAMRIMLKQADKISLKDSIKLMLESAIPMSKLNPMTVEGADFQFVCPEKWSSRAMDPKRGEELMNDVKKAMPETLSYPAYLNKH